MIPLQASFDPLLAVILLSILLTFAIITGFIWAFGKISQSPETDDHGDGNGHGA